MYLQGSGSSLLSHTCSVCLQESLVSEVVPDPMEGEQTWPLEEELREAEGKETTEWELSTFE